MRYRLLGPVAVEADDGAPIHIPAPKRRMLLAVLLLNANRPVAVDDLIDALWEEPPSAARPSLHAHVSRLRAELGPHRIETAAPGYRIIASAGELDVDEFRRLCAAARVALDEARWTEASRLLKEALSLWQGSALADVRDSPRVDAQAMALDEARMTAREDRFDADLHHVAPAALVEELETLARMHPDRERLWKQLMLALYRSGRQVDALAAYRELRGRLVDDLGVDPSPELQELEARMLRQDPSLAASSGGRQPSVRLPAFLAQRIGRDDDLEDLISVVRTHRLVTLTGPGGVGKTRLAVEAAHRLAAEFPDGAVFVDLSAVRDPGLVVATIGLEIGGGERPWEVILDGHLLLVLDNFEQVLEAAPAISDLLARCPQLHAVVTSRAALRLRGERVFDVAPLDADAAARLFIARAHDAMRRWEPDDREVRAIATRLDGLPLAIELTAARIAAFAPRTLLAALDKPLEVMASGPRDAPVRHRALRDAIGWSYELLGGEARASLRRLAVFAGGFDMRAASAVADSSVGALAELVDHSLVRRDGERYGMLETIREYANELSGEVGEAEDCRNRHLAYVIGLVTGARAGDDGVDSRAEWLATCRRERDNLRAAFAWALERSDGEAAVRLAGATSIYWLIVGSLQEGEAWCRAAMGWIPDSEPLRRAKALMVLAEFPRWSGRHREAIDLRTEALGLARAAGDDEIVATLLDDLAWSLGADGRLQDADTALDEALALRRSAPEDDLGMGHTLAHLGWLRIRQQRPAEALGLAIETRAAESRAGVAATTSTETDDLEAAALLACGRLTDAEALYERVLDNATQMDFRLPMLDALVGLATIAATQDPHRAARLLGMADRVRAQSGLAVFDPRQFETVVTQVRQQVGDEAFQALWLGGHSAADVDVARG